MQLDTASDQGGREDLPRSFRPLTPRSATGPAQRAPPALIIGHHAGLMSGNQSDGVLL